ncbi:14448_t:CDS:1, partial [Racocetra fulgida]
RRYILREVKKILADSNELKNRASPKIYNPLNSKFGLMQDDNWFLCLVLEYSDL